jgi:3-dehydroquinate synthase
VARAHSGLVPAIETYCDAHAGSVALAAPPLVVPGGEGVKNDIAHPLQVLARINDAGLDRQSFVIAIGGGAVLDMVSFAAALAHRSVRAVRLPTTVLSQADSGIGVKNSINMFGKKNFLGTFVPPFAVINDSRFLETLTRRDRIAGMAEVVKVALLRDRGLFNALEAHAGQIASDWQGVLEPFIRRSAELHLAHICGSGDPFEHGSARPLDFGHWAAHKIEALSDYRLRHGEAVALGLAVDVTYSARMGHLGRPVADRILALLEALGFELWDPMLVQLNARGTLAVIDGLAEFREHLGGELHITMLRDIGDGFEVTEADDTVVTEAIGELARRAGADVAHGSPPADSSPS